MAKGTRAQAHRRYKVLVVDDHPIVRERLAEMIDQEPDLAICGEAEDAHDALAAVAAKKPDLAIVDISLRDSYGIELIKDIRIRHPDLAVLVLSMHDESLYAERALRAGARGYITKQEATTEVLSAIRRVLAGDIYLSDRMAATILRRVAGKPAAADSTPVSALTDRELEVFQLIGQGLKVSEIARTLHISAKTVEAHRAHIKEKLRLKSSADLLRYAIQSVMQEG